MIVTCLAVGDLQANCYIVGDPETKEVAVIDPGDEGERIYKHITQNGFSVKYILLTHGHADHISGVKYIKERTNALIAIHQKESEALIDSRENLAALMGRECIQSPADVLLADEDTIAVGKHMFVVLYTPGHTQGGICILVDGHLFSGDTLFLKSIGRTDLPGGDYETLIQSINTKILPLPEETIVYPGHGPQTTVAEEKTGNPFLQG